VICPVDCIAIESRKKMPEENPEERTPPRFHSKPKRLQLLRFEIDEALCCFCGLCVEVCPTECLVHTPEFEYAKYDRDQLNYDYLEFTDENPRPQAAGQLVEAPNSAPSGGGEAD
jgi:NADH-quinone oxidoreductase subunit I